MSKKAKQTASEAELENNNTQEQEAAQNEANPETEAQENKETAEDAEATQENNEAEEAKDEQTVKIETLEAGVKEWQDKYLRLSAEFDNYRRRTMKQMADLTKTAGEELLVELLSVIDDFERAQISMEKATDVDAVKEGVDLIYNKFTGFVKQKGIVEIDAKEKELDVDFHEAITKIPAPTEELKGKVVDVVQKGYMLHDKVVRFAKVVIGE